MRGIKLAFLMGLSALMIVSYQNCGKSDFALNQRLTELGSSSPDPDNNNNNDNDGGLNTDSFATLVDWNGDYPAADDVPDCMDNPNYNACLVYKDPVTANGGPFATPYSRNNSTPAQERRVFTYGINLPVDGDLSNASFVIRNQGTIAESDQDGSWKFRFGGDSNHNVSQINAFYWLNRQKTYMVQRTGTYYLSNRALNVNVYGTGNTLNGNAFYSFQGNNISMGHVQNDQGGDLSVDVSVLAHEAGHGNVYWGTRETVYGAIGCPFNNQAPCCPDKDGCYAAMNEAMGDIHSFILFPDKPPAIGLYFANANSGLRDPEAIADNNLSAQDVFDAASGTIHRVGLTYGSIWYEVWNKYKQTDQERVIEEIFTAHIAGLSANDNFTSALDIIESIAPTVDPALASQIIADFRSEYDRLGVTRN